MKLQSGADMMISDDRKGEKRMSEWKRYVQSMVERIDRCIRAEDDAISEETFCERLEKFRMQSRHSDYISAMSVLRKDFINTQSE